MAKYVTGYSAEGWRAYALRMAGYGAQLRAAGVPYEHAERARVRKSIMMAVDHIKREERHITATGRLMRVIRKAQRRAHYTPLNWFSWFRLFVEG